MTKGEKRLLGVTIGGVGLLILVASWRAILEADPVVNIPTPKMPSPNANDFYLQAANAHNALIKATPGWATIDPVTDSRESVDLTEQQLAQRYPLAPRETWIRKNAGVLQLLRRGFAYDYHAPPGRSASTLLPYLQRAAQNYNSSRRRKHPQHHRRDR